MIIDISTTFSPDYVKHLGFKLIHECRICKSSTRYHRCMIIDYEGVAVFCNEDNGPCQWTVRIYKPTNPVVVDKWNRVIYGE